MAHSVVLIHSKKRPRENAKNLSLCIICQKEKKLQFCSTDNGTLNLKTASNSLGDNLFAGVDDDIQIVYHMKCYKPYILRGERAELNKANEEDDDEEESEQEDAGTSVGPELRGRKCSDTGGKGTRKHYSRAMRGFCISVKNRGR